LNGERYIENGPFSTEADVVLVRPHEQTHGMREPVAVLGVDGVGVEVDHKISTELRREHFQGDSSVQQAFSLHNERGRARRAAAKIGVEFHVDPNQVCTDTWL